MGHRDALDPVAPVACRSSRVSHHFWDSMGFSSLAINSWRLDVMAWGEQDEANHEPGGVVSKLSQVIILSQGYYTMNQVVFLKSKSSRIVCC